MYDLIQFTEGLQEQIINFYCKCLPESGREFEPKGRHEVLTKVKYNYDMFWCLKFNDKIIGTIAINKLSANKCELKSMYLLSEYHGNGLGQGMMDKALEYAKEKDFKEMYLDTLSSSERAIRLYVKNGFKKIERYNDNMIADVFMKSSIK